MILPETPFYLFGMGRREKYIYKKGKLLTLSGAERLCFSAAKETIIPEEYRVELKLTDGTDVVLFEDEDGFWVDRNGEKERLADGKISLPRFAGHPYARQLRILLQEILFNIATDGRPLPNLFVYSKPWYRDSAMIAMVLQKTGNLHLIRDFVLTLDECYDRNNAGNCEPDNLGQALYLISVVSDKNHPLVPKLTEIAKSLWTDAGMPGLIDFCNHPVYSAKWLKYGLSALGLDHSWVKIPVLPDTYSPLFWMAYKDEHVEVPRRGYDALYPYLWWAEQHFYEEKVPDSYLEITYPMTNETKASQADYEGTRVLSENYANAKNSAPHTWHSAEMFLYLMDLA